MTVWDLTGLFWQGTKYSTQNFVGGKIIPPPPQKKKTVNFKYYSRKQTET